MEPTEFIDQRSELELRGSLIRFAALLTPDEKYQADLIRRTVVAVTTRSDAVFEGAIDRTLRSVMETIFLDDFAEWRSRIPPE